jgi:MFS family permease
VTDSRAALKIPDVRRLLAASAFSTLAGRALAVVIGYQIYAITHDKLALGWLGLVEAIPAVSLALFGGHVADHTDRRRIILMTQTTAVLCAVAFALLSLNPAIAGLLSLYAVVFVAGIARGFSDPAVAAFESQVVPRELYVGTAALQASVWQGCAIIGPAIGGIAYGLIGVTATYGMIAVLFFCAWISVWRIPPRPLPPAPAREPIFRSIALGVRYVFGNQILVGSMALDLFAVLFGGAIALLPVFSQDILHCGPERFGLLNAAPSVGALLIMLWSTRHPPVRRAGRNLILSVFGFGISMIVFAFSTNFWLSIFALAASGGLDGISMVIRKSILRIMSPDHLRGRISAVSSIFIGSSNEIGAFESGVAAKYLGTVRSVWLGGVVTLLVVAVAAAVAPRLRRLDLTAVPSEDSDHELFANSIDAVVPGR